MAITCAYSGGCIVGLLYEVRPTIQEQDCFLSFDKQKHVNNVTNAFVIKFCL